MALATGLITINEVSIYSVDSDPSTTGGITNATPSIGDIAILDNGVTSGQWFFGAGSVWAKTPVSAKYSQLTGASNVLVYTAGQEDYFYGVNNGTASNITITLPTASTQKAYITIKDELFNSGKYLITVLPNGTDKIDNSTSFIINSNGASVTFYNDFGITGTKWYST